MDFFVGQSLESHLLIMGLILGLMAAAITDIQSSRIPNWLTFSLAGWGMTLHTIEGGLEGFLFSLEGLGIGIGCLLLFYIKGGMGAGDVKFLGGIGAVLGSLHVFQVFLITALLGGLYALATMVTLGGLGYARDRVFLLLSTLKVTRQLPAADRTRMTEPKLRYALVIGLGTVISQTLTWYDMW